MFQIDKFYRKIFPHSFIIRDSQNMQIIFIHFFIRKKRNFFKDVISESFISTVTSNDTFILWIFKIQIL